MIVLDANAAVAMAKGGEAGQELRMLVGNGEAVSYTHLPTMVIDE